jgi:hypothetical protein
LLGAAARAAWPLAAEPRTDVNFYVKIWAFNPLGFVKDRLALGVIEARLAIETEAAPIRYVAELVGTDADANGRFGG